MQLIIHTAALHILATLYRVVLHNVQMTSGLLNQPTGSNNMILTVIKRDNVY